MRKPISVMLVLYLVFSSIVPAAALFTSTMKKGDKGDAVKELQERLIELEYLQGNAEGDFSGKTEAAVKDLQMDNGYFANGIIDKAQYDMIFSDATTKRSAVKKHEDGEFTAISFINWLDKAANKLGIIGIDFNEIKKSSEEHKYSLNIELAPNNESASDLSNITIDVYYAFSMEKLESVISFVFGSSDSKYIDTASTLMLMAFMKELDENSLVQKCNQTKKTITTTNGEIKNGFGQGIYTITSSDMGFASSIIIAYYG